jgi:mannosyl-oligosaccharide alpha-1,2-mannosidase
MFTLLVFAFFSLYLSIPNEPSLRHRVTLSALKFESKWANLPQRYPVEKFQRLPQRTPHELPKIQHDFGWEGFAAKRLRESRLRTVRESFAHAWKGYRKYAWMGDEVGPLTGESHATFGNWSATLVDSLDTLWIMGFKKEFDEAVDAVAAINFEESTSETLSVFETTIRYLGGLLSAYDLSGRTILLKKALELGNMLYAAFDTPNRMPVPYWDWKKLVQASSIFRKLTINSALDGGLQDTVNFAVSADIGSLSLEFTRLSQLSGDPKFFDAVQRISDIFADQQDESPIPGLWPTMVRALNTDFSSGNEFSLGALADSLYEYIPKMYLLLGGLDTQYGRMYEKFIAAAKKYLFFRPINPENRELLISGILRITDRGQMILDPSGQHLACFVSGMIGIASKTFKLDDLDVAEKLAEGCVWAYESIPAGIMPEIVNTVPCIQNCTWSEEAWHQAVMNRARPPPKTSVQEVISVSGLPPGFAGIQDGRYILRPEAIESVFIMYRITGDVKWQDKAWKMFLAIEKATRTTIAHASIEHVADTPLKQVDKMESFWTAETLKYFYLIFSKPSVISLDDYVFNTEAHPFLRPKKHDAWLS